MPRRPDARTLLFEKIRSSPPRFVHITGVPYQVELEPVRDDALEPAQVWLSIEVPPFGRLRTILNTTSKRSAEAGFDARIRVGIVAQTWTEKPSPGLIEDPGQDYSGLEAALGVEYRSYEEKELRAMLVERARIAVRAEVWGELYAREHLGVHQIHSRRASSAVATDLKRRDGALKLYYATENRADLFLFKFAGQP
jgi:hypothetical protein